MIFVIWRKNTYSLLRCLYFLFLWNPQILKTVLPSQTLLHNESNTYAYFYWILSTIKIKFGLILAYCMPNTSNIVLAQCRTLESSSKPFYDFITKKIWQDPVFFYFFFCWHLQFLNIPYSYFQKTETLESWFKWSLSNWSRLLNWKQPGT